jgi:hypothetical protein
MCHGLTSSLEKRHHPASPFEKRGLDMCQGVTTHFGDHHEPASPFAKGGLRGIYLGLNKVLAA